MSVAARRIDPFLPKTRDIDKCNRKTQCRLLGFSVTF